MSVTTSPPFEVESVEDREVVGHLGRLLYLVYCERKNFTPRSAPYVPAWAIDYARTAVLWLGYDVEGQVAIREVVGAA